MRIINACVVLGCLAATTLAADEHRPVKKKDDRGKRNLEYQISHHYPGPPTYHLERRISTGPQHPLYPPPQFYPGLPRPYSPYHKGRPYSYPVPPYAVQMEPLVHYSQRDPLYDTNIFSLNADPPNDLGRDDLLTENNHIQDKIQHDNHVYGPHKPHIIERPVYIKEPEPIIEIIIKESNVSLPAPPTLPPPKKKKEQVQVFYVKYKKNPHGTGKDSVIYDKPIPAISPNLPTDDEEEEDQAPYSYQKETATAIPPPTTTLRTIIKPDSEVYHSPSGVKVTFGKEGFDYDKRSSKPEDYPVEPAQVPQGRQLTSFSNTYFKRPSTNPNFQSAPPSFRAPQPYRPFSFPPPPPSNHKAVGRQTSPQFSSQPRPSFQSPVYTKPSSQQYSNFPGPRPQSAPSPQFSHTISHPPPPQFQNPRSPPSQTRQPVPYKPFDNLRPLQQQSYLQQSPQFSQPLPLQQQQSFVLPPQQLQQLGQSASHINPNPAQPQIHFRPETHFPSHQQLPLTQQSHTFNPATYSQQSSQANSHQQFRKEQPLTRSQQIQLSQQLQQSQQPQQTQYQHQINHNQFGSQNQQIIQQQPITQKEHLSNIQPIQSILPPGGQLIQSLPKYEQHISEVQPISNQKDQGLTSPDFRQKILEQFNLNNAPVENNHQSSQQAVQQQQQHQQHTLQEISDQQRQQQEQQLGTAQQYFRQTEETRQRNLQSGVAYTTPSSVQVLQSSRRTTHFANSTPRVIYQTTTTPTTTTHEPETPSTTTKDPKILEAQLPDEVPDDLREQLLSSGILNNADISILDYDKVGDIPLSALPPDQLANFYSAGGGAQIAAGSAPEPAVLQRDGSRVEDRIAEAEEDQEPGASEIQEVKAAPPPGVEMKVVRYDPETDKGKAVQDSYIEEDAQQVDPVVLNDNTYNRYLPLKVNGTQFPIPDVPELKGKKISSVVVLAPVSYDFSSGRKTREAKPPSDIELVQGDDLKKLLENPTLENYNKFLESENKTATDKQAVILLVAGPQDTTSKEKEIFMYDVATQTVSKLSGELSSAFVEAAEANSSDEATPEDSTAAAASNIIETRVPFTGNANGENPRLADADLDAMASEFVNSKVPIIDPTQDEVMETEASEQLERFVDISGTSISSQEDLHVSDSEVDSNSVENH